MKYKREIIYIVTIVILIGLLGQFWYSYEYKPAKDREINVYYNHDRELNIELIQLIREADEYVYFAIYTFTRADIKDALLAAKYRGAKIIGITDKDQIAQVESQGKIIKELRDAGIAVHEESHSGIMHLKTVVTEKGYASGSYNWTASATTLNDEVLEVGRDRALRQKYEDILLEIFSKYPLPDGL
jgi:phosphatidylserine/phosphatidylglycerophosphate/cardiolipin synthase-like enzyme